MAINLTLRRDLSRLLTSDEVDNNFTALATALQGIWDSAGVPNGIATLGANGRLPAEQAPIVPATVIAAGTNANDVVEPGSYYINSDADATVANNWPELRAGTLVVECAAAGNMQVTQTYTTRSGSGGVSRTYKRTRFTTSLTWAGWQEQARAVDTVRKISLTTAKDANTLTTENVYFTWAGGAAMDGGANWPATIFGSGSLQVTMINATDLLQSLTVVPGAGGRPTNFQRAQISGTWGAWHMVAPVSIVADLPTADHGDVYVDGDGWYSWNGAAYARRSLAKTLDGVNLNTIDVPGTYACNVSAEATGALNYPVQLAGILEVVASSASSLQVTQTYTAFPETNPSTFKRVRFGASKVWGPWFEQARSKDAMRRIALGPAGVNFNTLTADNTYYTWSDGTVLTAGSNGPPVAAASVGAGSLNVWYFNSGFVIQECVLPINGQKPRRFTRLGFGSSWEPWKIIGSLSSTHYLPTADCGDVHVDGFGWCRWNGTAYTGQTIVGGELVFTAGSTIWGNFPGQDSVDGNVFRARSGTTYLQAAPGPGAAGAAFIARGAKSPDAQFAMLAMDSATGVSNLLFSRHGSAAIPSRMIIASATGECASVWHDGSWQFGRTITPNVTSRMHVSYLGGSTMYGLVLRPTEFANTTAVQFQQYNGLVAGYIQCMSDLSTIYATTSDYRSKTVLGVLDPEESLVTINALRPVRFRMNGAQEGSAPQRGFVAHELQSYVPGAVSGEKDEMMDGPDGPNSPKVPKFQGVDMGRVMPDMVAAVQRLTQMLAESNARIERLEAAGSSAALE